MTDKKYIQRLKLVLKCGSEFAIDFNAEENGKINPQIEKFVQLFSDFDPEEDHSIVFGGERMIGVRISEIAAYEVLSLTFTPKAQQEKSKE